jgi:LysR family transcriptional regulator, low CO2-responsive transcriptional regulator
MAIRYSQWRAFDAVVREGSVSKAAARLSITQPAVTLQIKALEAAAGVTLFRHQGRTLVLTPAGRTIFVMARRMFEAEAEIHDYLRASAALEGGMVRLAADGPHVALEIIRPFRQRYPDVQIAVSLGNAQAAWQDLVEERVDAAVISNPKRTSTFRFVPLLRQAMVALVPLGHRFAGRTLLDLKDLQGEQLVLREAGSNTRRTLDRALAHRRIQVTSMLELDSREAVREAVAAGLGIGFMFEREARNDPRVAAIMLSGMEDSSRDTLVFRRGDQSKALIRALIGIAGEIAKAA